MAKGTLGDVCIKAGSNIAQKDLIGNTGCYPIFGAGGFIQNVDFYQQEEPYIAIVKDGAGIGRAMMLPAKSSVIGTMQYILPKDSQSVDLEYLYYAIANMNLGKYFSGATIPHIYFRDYQNEPINLPDLDEQRMIARIFKRIDELTIKRKEQIEALNELVKSRFIELFGDPVDNEMQWPTKSLEEACRVIVDCPHSTPNYTSQNTGFMCIRTSIVKKNYIIWDDIEFISEEEYNKRIQRKKPEKGDVIYTREGAILGIAAVIDKECNVALGQRAMLLSPDANQCNSIFLCNAMNCDSFLANALKGQSGSASPHINVGDIKAFKMIMPPIKLQQQFAAFVAQVDKSKFVVQKSLQELETLKKSLMQEYFG